MRKPSGVGVALILSVPVVTSGCMIVSAHEIKELSDREVVVIGETAYVVSKRDRRAWVVETRPEADQPDSADISE